MSVTERVLDVWTLRQYPRMVERPSRPRCVNKVLGRQRTLATRPLFPQDRSGSREYRLYRSDQLTVHQVDLRFTCQIQGRPHDRTTERKVMTLSNRVRFLLKWQL